MYFDNAATSFPRPDSVIRAVEGWLRDGCAAGRGGHAGAVDAGQLVQRCRMSLARILGLASSRQVVLTSGCTESLNTVLLGLLGVGDRVIASELDHNSVLRPLAWLQRTRGIQLELLGFDVGTGLLDAAQLERLLDAGPVRLVVLTHASNVTGRVQRVSELAAMAASRGALVLVDAAQTAGHWPCTLDGLGADFLALPGHKGLCGPLGTGVLVFREGREDLVSPLKFGGTGTESELLEQPEGLPEKFESGNLNMPGIAGLGAAADWVLERTPELLRANLVAKTDWLSAELARVSGLRLLTPSVPGEVCGIVSFVVSGVDAHEAALVLEQAFGIRSRAGLHCAPLVHRAFGTESVGGAVRLSVGEFTTESELALAVSAVAELARVAR
ncbi:MAG: putative cysteine desulfurase [Planctomycetota bacterium]|jgi:selenocysteine lyase/cysteine desulfurase